MIFHFPSILIKPKPSTDGLSQQMEMEKDEHQTSKAEPDLDSMAQQVQNFKKFISDGL